MHILYIGLGKMGHNMVERMLEKGHTVTAFDPDEAAREKTKAAGATVVDSIKNLAASEDTPRTVWLMVPHQAVDAVLEELVPQLEKGDTIIEGGNSPFKETKKRAAEITEQGIRFLDAGVSGGPGGAKDGACIMVGGERNVYDEYETLFKDLSVPNGYGHMGGYGAGHFVKMVHNGIEYGMMQAIAEGFDIMRQSDFDLPLPTIAELYNHGSVIESSLVGWLASGYAKHGTELEGITGSASASGEGLWTVETAKEMGVDVAVIEDSLNARTKSQEIPSYQGQVISVLRNEFGGHHAASDKA